MIYRSVIRSAIDDKGAPNLRAANPHYPGVTDDDDDDDRSHDYIFDRTAIDELLSTRVADDAPDIPFELPSEKTSIETEDALTSLAEVISKIHEQDEFNKYGVIPDPSDLIGFTFPTEHEGITQRAKVMDLQPDKHKAVIELMDGSHALIDYHLLLEKFNMPSEDGNQIFTFTGFSGHKKIKGAWHLLVNWDGVGYEPSWEPLTTMKDADPITCASYAREHNLLNQKGWKWAKKIKVDARRLIRIAKRIYSAKRTSDLYKFGIQVPQTVDEALAIDKAAGNTLWKDAIEKELGQILEYDTFNILPHGERAPADHKRVPLHLVFDVKHDGRRKARLVAGGHVTDPANEEVYSSVVAPEGVRLVMFLADHNGLDIMCGDVGNAFLNGVTREKIWCIAGPEFGPKIAGRVLIVVKGLYGLRTSGARWSEAFADSLRSIGWKMSKAENDVWMKDCGTHYEYLAVYCDDILVAGKDPKALLDEIQKIYTLKGVGMPDYFLGAEFGRINGEFTERGVTSTWSAKTYLKNVIDRFERLLGNLRTYTCPMDPDYHPELDDSPMLGPTDKSMFRSLIGSAQWAITLGRMDITYAVSMLSRYNMAPREGHLLAMKKLFGYLKGHMKGKIVFDTRKLDVTHATFVNPASWKQVYGNVKEELPPGMPIAKMKPIDINLYFDASFGCDMLTRRSVTGVIVFLNGTPIKWICKKQNTVETSTYGAELVAGRLAAEVILEFRYKLRMLGVPVEKPSIMLGDNMSVIQNCSLPSSQLKKKHNAIAYHRLRECVACDIIKLGHVRSEQNYADLCTKALSGPKLHGLSKDLIFRSLNSRECHNRIQNDRESHE